MRKALIVGLDNYPECPLTGCVNDAVAVADILCVVTGGDGNEKDDR